MNITEVKLIEDNSNGQLKENYIAFNENCLFIGPTDIQNAEYWEEQLLLKEIPYVLAQFIVTQTSTHGNSRVFSTELDTPVKGYGLFLNPIDLQDIRDSYY